MANDVCIKANSYCPVCKGIAIADCWHEVSQFVSIPAGYRLQPHSEFDAYKNVLRQIGNLERDNAQLQFALEQSESKWIKALAAKDGEK